MTSYVRPSRNFVNLGNLYKGRLRLKVTTHVCASQNFVNLGNLYSFNPLPQRPHGFGYFEDGSLFIAPRAYLEHDVFEARMKSAAQLFSASVPDIQAIEAKRSHGKRVIVINKDTDVPKTKLQLAIRNARDKDYLSMHDSPYDNVTLVLDDTGTQLVSTRVRHRVIMDTEHERTAKQALQCFRGTLIDGTLQPNVRLGNGLVLSGLPIHAIPRKLSRREEREKNSAFEPQSHEEPEAPPAVPSKLSRRERRRITNSGPKVETPRIRSLPHTEREAPPVVWSEPDQQERHREVSLELKAARLKAKEEELRHKEEILRWKHRAWSLEQKLAKRHSPVSKRRVGFAEERAESTERRPGLQRGIKDRPDRIKEEPSNTFLTRKDSLPDPWLASTDDPFPPDESSALRRQPELGRGTDVSGAKPMEDSTSGPQPQSSGDPFSLDSFNLDSPTPPRALADLRSRVAMPGRRIHDRRRGT